MVRIGECSTTATRGSESRRRLEERIAPAIRTVLQEYGLAEAIGAETLATAVVARLVSGSPRVTVRHRLLAQANGTPVCWICGLRIPMDAAEDTAECFSIDHIVPRAKGGTQMGFANLRAAHRLCIAIREIFKPSPKLIRSLDDMLHRLRRIAEPT